MQQKNQFTPMPPRFLYRLIAGMLASMLVSMLLLAQASWDMSRHHVPLVSAAHELRLQTVQFHLWFEEYLQGDRYIPAEKVWGYLNQAEWYGNAMLNGGNGPEGTIVPLGEADLSNDIRLALGSIRKLREIGQKRLERRNASGIGSPIDQEFDRDYSQVMNLSMQVENVLLAAIDKETRRFRVFSYLIVSLMLAAAAGVARLVYVHERTRNLYEEKIHSQAFYDSLTGLPNRCLFYDRLQQEMAASKRSGTHCALIFLDLDNFKALNDSHGHGIGDLLLVEVASRLSRCVRKIDTVARFGGDEFVVMLCNPGSDKEEAIAQAGIVAEKIRAALAEPYRLQVTCKSKAGKTVEHPCSASIGLVVFDEHDESPDEIIKRADTAMYSAKASGGNSVSVHNPEAENLV